VRRIAGGARDHVMRFWRFLANERVTVEKLIEGWSEQTREAVRGRHVLAIQDTSDIKFSTTPNDRRGLGKVGKGNIFLACCCFGFLPTRRTALTENPLPRTAPKPSRKTWIEAALAAVAVPLRSGERR
jgi:hypothetical protein